MRAALLALPLACGLRSLPRGVGASLAASTRGSMAAFSAAAGEAAAHPKVALIQLMVTDDKPQNLAHARSAIARAAATGAKLVSLPECFNSPYATSAFPRYAEPIPPAGTAADEVDATASPTTAMLCAAAREEGVLLVGGSLPEREGEAVYNTCVVVDEGGRLLAKHRKVHLFDIDVPGGQKFTESDTLTAGSSVTVVETPIGRVGIAICYDMRFSELAQLMRKRGCIMIIYPGAFNMTTGPPHWELLLRSRALDNQLYVAGVSPARNPDSTYQAWGHSTVVGPWGDVLATTDHGEDIVVAEIDVSRVDQVRQSIPTSHQLRRDMYELVDKTTEA